MANDEPFILSKRKDSPYYQVRFKNPNKNSAARFLPAKSTKETVKSKALAKAWSMYNQDKIDSVSILQSISIGEVSEKEAERLLETLKARGIINSYSLANQQSVKAVKFLQDFWDNEKSPYLAEKKRTGQHIGIIYVEESKKIIDRYWAEFFDSEILLSQVTRKMLKDFILYVDEYDLSWSRKQKIYRAGAVALKWAYNEELIDRDITAGIASFYGKSKERSIVTKEMAELLFSVEWEDERCKLINLIAMLTGMRCGEILALRKMDLGENCLYVRHSWNRKEGLKTTKNGEGRIVYFPFPSITNRLMYYADISGGLEDFIFQAPLVKTKPMDIKLPNKYLHKQLQKIGLSKEEAMKYCFHSWRHFYTTYMSDKLNNRVLQSQTGHKTLSMLEHYGNHKTDSDIKMIESAQKEVFGEIVSISGY